MTFLIFLVLLLSASYLFHRWRLKVELPLTQPLGQMVEVDGKQMSILVKGEGPKTLVFLAGGGTVSPILDFKSLYSLLEDQYRIVVIEKFGYGFSEATDASRKLDRILEECRSGLNQLGIQGPFVLIPHSMSGLLTISWATHYPEEVEAVIGLDMATPESYLGLKFNQAFLLFLKSLSQIGIIRWFPGVSETDAIKSGSLTDFDKKIYQALFYKRTLNQTILNEMIEVQAEAKKLLNLDLPSHPYLLFVSNGKGVPMDVQVWQAYQGAFANQVQAELIHLAYPHYLHDYGYVEMSQVIKSFLSTLA